MSVYSASSQMRSLRGAGGLEACRLVSLGWGAGVRSPLAGQLLSDDFNSQLLPAG